MPGPWKLTDSAKDWLSMLVDEPVADYEPGQHLMVLCPCLAHTIVFPLAGPRPWKVARGSSLADLSITPSIRFVPANDRCHGHYCVTDGYLHECGGRGPTDPKELGR